VADMPQPSALLVLLLVTSALASPAHIIFMVADDMVSSHGTEHSQCVIWGIGGQRDASFEIPDFLAHNHDRGKRFGYVYTERQKLLRFLRECRDHLN
jgi:hypothetical protein